MGLGSVEITKQVNSGDVRIDDCAMSHRQFDTFSISAYLLRVTADVSLQFYCNFLDWPRYDAIDFVDGRLQFRHTQVTVVLLGYLNS